MSDSLRLLKGQKFNIDIFLEILISCYSIPCGKTSLMCFNIRKAIIPAYEIDTNEYSKILTTIEEKPEIIIKYCTEKDDSKEYYKKFYTLLLYFRINFEEDKIQELLSKKDLWIYFKEILPINYKIFRNMHIPSELINQMINQTPLSFKIIEGTLFYLKFLEKILICINEYIDIIYEVCIKEEKLLKMNKKILIEIDKLINYELKKEKFVLFEKAFFNIYTHYYYRKDLKKLLLIKKAILLCKKVDKELEPDYLGRIHEKEN